MPSRLLTVSTAGVVLLPQCLSCPGVGVREGVHVLLVGEFSSQRPEGLRLRGRPGPAKYPRCGSCLTQVGIGKWAVDVALDVGGPFVPGGCDVPNVGDGCERSRQHCGGVTFRREGVRRPLVRTSRTHRTPQVLPLRGPVRRAADRVVSRWQRTLSWRLRMAPRSMPASFRNGVRLGTVFMVPLGSLLAPSVGPTSGLRSRRGGGSWLPPCRGDPRPCASEAGNA